MRFTRWSLSGKLTAVHMAYLLPCAVLIFFLIKEKDNQLNFSKKEVAGNEYNRVLVDLLQHVSQHKILGIAKAGGHETLGNAQSVRDLIEKDYKALSELDQRYGEILLFNDAELQARKRSQAAVNVLKNSWNAAAASEAENPQELIARHDKLIGDIRTAIAHVTDTSNLILDPDLDSYYLMDIVTGAIPELIDRLQQEMTFLMTEAGAENSKLMAAQLRTLTFSHILQSTVERVQNDLNTSINEDKNFFGGVSTLQRDMPDHMKDLGNRFARINKMNTALVNDSMSKEKITVDEDQITVMMEAMDATLRFYHQTADNLDKMLETRISAHSSQKYEALAWTLLVWLIPSIISLLTVRRLSRLISHAVSKLANQAESANRSSSQLAQASSIVSSGSTEQAAAIQETGASMSEMASMIARSASQASSSQELAKRVTERADEGCKVMERMVLSMDSIQQANSQLQNISTIIHEISSKTNVINDIVGKTQLLSFNASIEAARAGQHGRGFAVVAEEVGNLAQTSGNAAKSIRDLIEDSQRQVAHILKSTLERVAEGKVVTEKAQTIFSGIAHDIGMISTQVESVSEAAREQQYGIEQISKAMVQMDQTTQSNNKAALTAAQLSDQLAGQSQRLSVIAGSVSELVFGGNTSVPATPSVPGNRTPPDSRPDNRNDGDGRSRDDLMQSIVDKAQNLDQYDNVRSLNADDDSFRKAV